MDLQHLGTPRIKLVSVITEWLYVAYIVEYLTKTDILWNKTHVLYTFSRDSFSLTPQNRVIL